MVLAVLLAFNCASVFGNLWSICWEAIFLSSLPFVTFIGNIPFLKVLRVNSRSSQREHSLLKVSHFI